MKYGINIVEGQLKAVSEFIDDVLPDGFKEISKEKYNELLDNITPFSVFDEKTVGLVENLEIKKELEEQAEIGSTRQKLSSLVSELILAERLGEDTSILQKQFDDLSKEYKGYKNIPPRAYAGLNQSITLPKNVKLTGTATDKDGKVVSVNWSKIDGGNAVIVKSNQLSTEVTGLEAGSYRFRLTAIDDKGANAISDVNIHVKPKGAIKISISPKEKHNIPVSGAVFQVNIKSNTEWHVLGKGNSSVSPSSGRGNGEVTVRVHKNDFETNLIGTVEFRAGNEVVNLLWSQKGHHVYDGDPSCFDLESNVTMSNGRNKKLKNIKVGDILSAYQFDNMLISGNEEFRDWEPMLEQSSMVEAEVKDFAIATVQEYRKITLINGIIINVTDSHPLLASKDKKEVAWLLPDDLRAGLYLVNKKGDFVEIESKKTIKETLDIGLLKVEGVDNYIVEGCLVHNAEIFRSKPRKAGEVDAIVLDDALPSPQK